MKLGSFFYFFGRIFRKGGNIRIHFIKDIQNLLQHQSFCTAASLILRAHVWLMTSRGRQRLLVSRT